METAGKLVEDEELAEAMKERGLGTPATRADIIDGLIYQKYMDRNQRELVPSAKAEQLIQFLEAVKASDLTSPAMTGEWEHQLREMTRGKFSREKFMAGIVEETKGIVERVKNFEEDDSIARETEILSPTDKKPLRETLRGYKSQDGEFMIYKVIGGRRMEESEIRELVEKGEIGPLDGFHLRENARQLRGQAQTRPRREDREMESRIRFRRQRRSRLGRIVLDRSRDRRRALRSRLELRSARERKRRMETDVSCCRA